MLYLQIRGEGEAMNCPKCGSENTGLEDIDCYPVAYYRDVPTCHDCGHHFLWPDALKKCGHEEKVGGEK